MKKNGFKHLSGKLALAFLAMGALFSFVSEIPAYAYARNTEAQITFTPKNNTTKVRIKGDADGVDFSYSEDVIVVDIEDEGYYVLSGEAYGVVINVADDLDSVSLELDDLIIDDSDFSMESPVILVGKDTYAEIILTGRSELTGFDLAWEPPIYGPSATLEYTGTGSLITKSNSEGAGSFSAPATPGSRKSEYIFPDSDTELIDKKDAETLSDEELRFAINEIYARHGRKFSSKELQEYFESKSWYEGKYTAYEFEKKNLLSKTEKKNVDILGKVRDSRKESANSNSKTESKGKDFIFPDSDTKLIDKKEAEKLSDEDLRIAINEIYARAGRKFATKDLNEYFSGKSWYEGKYTAEEFEQKNPLSKTEKKNINILSEIRNSRSK